MFPDDKYWLPLILEGEKIRAYFEFDENWNVLSKSIEKLDKNIILRSENVWNEIRQKLTSTG